MTEEHAKLLARVSDLERSTTELRTALEIAQRGNEAQLRFCKAAIAYAEAKQTIEPQASEYKRTLAALREGK